MAAAAGGIIFCKVFGENILSFGGVCRHPIGDVTFGIIFCRGPNSTRVKFRSQKLTILKTYMTGVAHLLWAILHVEYDGDGILR